MKNQYLSCSNFYLSRCQKYNVCKVGNRYICLKNSFQLRFFSANLSLKWAFFGPNFKNQLLLFNTNELRCGELSISGPPCPSAVHQRAAVSISRPSAGRRVIKLHDFKVFNAKSKFKYFSVYYNFFHLLYLSKHTLITFQTSNCTCQGSS